MKRRVYYHLIACGGLVGIAASCNAPTGGSKSLGIGSGTKLDTLSVPTVTTLAACGAASEGEVVFLSSTGIATSFGALPDPFGTASSVESVDINYYVVGTE